MKVLIRADASSRIGTGHVMRCLALAQACQERGATVRFLCAEVPAPLETRLSGEGVRVTRLAGDPDPEHDLAQTIALARGMAADWLVLDGYHFGSAYQEAIKRAGLSLLFLDDYGHADDYCADLVLNQNISAEASLYSQRKPGTRLLLGTRFCLLRREFWPWRGWKRAMTDSADKVLVTMGGSDPGDMTLLIVRELMALNDPRLAVRIVAGPGNRHVQALEEALLLAPCAMRLCRDVESMPELMAWADIAISAGGSTCWELACMGLPSVLVSLSPDQTAICAGLGRIGAAVNLRPGEHGVHVLREQLRELRRNVRLRQEIGACARALVDGYGASRVVSAMAEIQLSGGERDAVPGRDFGEASGGEWSPRRSPRVTPR
jgi:UDP-2,4-diacetamido-2,4,6-trideoxy-beta-L-altropyranose hydrolase